MDPALKSLLQNCLKYGLATRRSCNSALCDKQPCSVRVNDVVLPPILLVLLHVLCPQRRVLHDSDLAPRRLSLERITKQTTTTPSIKARDKEVSQVDLRHDTNQTQSAPRLSEKHRSSRASITPMTGLKGNKPAPGSSVVCQDGSGGCSDECEAYPSPSEPLQLIRLKQGEGIHYSPYLELGKKAKLMFFPTGLRLTQGFGCLFSRLLGRFRSRFQSECRQHRSQVLKSFSPSGRPWRVNLSVGRKLCFVC